MNAGQKLPFSQFSAAHMRPRDQFEAWPESISVIFETSPLPDRPIAEGFAATLRAYHLGNLMVRDRRKLTRDGIDHCLGSVWIQRDAITAAAIWMAAAKL